MWGYYDSFSTETFNFVNDLSPALYFVEHIYYINNILLLVSSSMLVFIQGRREIDWNNVYSPKAYVYGLEIFANLRYYSSIQIFFYKMSKKKKN